MAEKNRQSAINIQHSDKVKNEFVEVYRKIGEKLSADDFIDYFDLLKEEVAVNADGAIETFKKLLVDELTKSLDKMWENNEIANSLGEMEALKEQFKDSSEPKWRPHGLSVEEQTIPLRVRMLKKQQKYFNVQKQYQQEQLEVVFSQIEQNRRMLDAHVKRRQNLVDIIERKTGEIDVEEKVLAKEIEQAVHDLDREL